MLIAGFFFAPLKKEVPKRAPKPLRETTSYRWSRVIQHHPWPAAITGVVILVVLALPFLGLRMGFSDEGNYAEDTTTRKAYDLIAEGFGPGFNGPLILATEIPAGTDPATLDQVTQTIQGTEGVAFASPAQVNEAGTAARWFVTPDDRAAGRGHHQPGERPPQRRAPGGDRRDRARRRGHRQRGHQRRLLRVPGRPVCPTSSPSCSACRSCS